MTVRKAEISKLISYLLRHAPGEANLHIDESGWAKISDLLDALKKRNVQLDLERLKKLTKSFDKIRWEFDKDDIRIRATHGHSIPVLMDGEAQTPPEILYHGTAVHHVQRISQQGLLPITRQYVHLSENLKTAIQVGKRHGKPFVIEIDAKELANGGWKFHKTSDQIWLTSEIPPGYLSFEPWYEVSVEQRDRVHEELRKEIHPSHLLYNQIEFLECIWRTGRNDDTLFLNTKTGVYYVVHLTWSGKEDRGPWPVTRVYNSFEEWVEECLWSDQQDYYDMD